MRYLLETAGTYLRQSVRMAESLRDAHEGDTIEGSAYARDLNALQGRRYQHLLDVVTLSSLRLAMVEDHLQVMGRTLADDRSIFPMYTLARTVAEVSARAWWLLEPGIDPDERAHRGLTERVYGWHEASLLPDADIARSARSKRRELLRQAGEAGMDVSRTKAPSASRLLEELLSHDGHSLGLFSYKLLSAFTHGTSYALQQLATKHRRPSDVEGMIQVQIGTTAQREANIVMMAFLPYREAVAREGRYFGWSPKDLKRLGAQLSYTSGELERHLRTVGGREP